MTLIRFNSPRTLSRMMQEGNAMHPRNMHAAHCAPSANVIEREDKFELEMAIPGMKKDEIQISLEKDILTVSSEKTETPNQDVTYNRKEFSYGKFFRSFSLPETIDRENIRADYRDGILRVELPKNESAKVQLKRQIEIA